MNRFLKEPFYSAFKLSRAYKLAKWAHRKKILIVAYHGILQRNSRSYVNRNCTYAQIFEEQLRWLKRNYTILPLCDILDGMENKKELPEYAAAITFDNGFRNNFEVALPILVKQNLAATVFLSTDLIGENNKKLWNDHVDALVQTSTAERLSLQMNGNLTNFNISSTTGKIQASDNIRSYLKALNPAERNRKILNLEHQVDGIDYGEDGRFDFLNWDEVRKMVEGGIEFGSNGASNTSLSTLSAEELRREVVESKNKIESELQRSCLYFSYPNGLCRDYSIRDKEMVRKTGYRAAFSMVQNLNDRDQDFFELKRININSYGSFGYFIAKATGILETVKRSGEKIWPGIV